MTNKTNVSHSAAFLNSFLINAFGGNSSGQSIAKVSDEEISIHQVNFVLSLTSGINRDSVETTKKLIANALLDQMLLNQQIMTYSSLGIDAVAHTKSMLVSSMIFNRRYQTIYEICRLVKSDSTGYVRFS